MEDDEWDDSDEEWDDEDDGALAADDWYAPAWRRQDPARDLTLAKLNVLERQGRADDYPALCLRAGERLRYALKLLELGRPREAVSHALKHLNSTGEALTLAQRLRESGHIKEAIRVGERGLQLGGRKAALGQWLGPIEETQGRKKQALEAWLAAFREAPSLALWQTIKRLAGSRWSRLKPQAVSSLEKFYDKQPLAGTQYLHADAEVMNEAGTETARAVISFGPEHDPMPPTQVELALMEANKLFPKPQFLFFAAFQFDPVAVNNIEQTNWQGVQLLKVQMNADLLTEDLKKSRRAS